MASGSAEGSVSTPPMNQIVDAAKPLWRHVIQLERTGGSGGNAKSKCRYCDAIIHGSYYRVKAHLLKISNCGVKTCPKVTVPILQQLRDEVAAAEAATSSATRRVPLPGENTSSNEVGNASQMGVVAKKRKGQLAIDKSFNLGLRSTMDALVARAFYTAGLPFNLARNPYWREMIMYACNNPLNGYVPPAYNRMRTTLLQQERTHVEGMLVPIKTT